MREQGREGERVNNKQEKIDSKEKKRNREIESKKQKGSKRQIAKKIEK